MDTYLTAEMLSTVSHNLSVGATLLECLEAEVDPQEMDPAMRQQLALVHLGLAMAMDALNTDQLQNLMDAEVPMTSFHFP